MRRIFAISALSVAALCAYAQEKAYFADGFHGGIYGHYPVETYTKFMSDCLDRYPEWKMSLEIEPETWDTVKVRTPEEYARFARLAGTGRVEITNPAYAQPYMYNISGESIIRQMQYGISKLKSHFPDAEIVTYAVEEPCFTSCLPQILTQLGFRYASLKCPDTCWGGYTSAYGGELVLWRGPDGSEILASPRSACEELSPGTVWQTMSWNNSAEYLAACREAGIQAPVGMCWQDAGWTFGPWIGYPGANGSEYVTWREYFEEITAGHPVETWNFSQEDVRPGLMWGTQVMQRLARQVRRTENGIVQTEKEGAIAFLENGFRYDRKLMDEAWRTLMLSQHHDSWIVPYNRLNRRGTWADNIVLWTQASDSICAVVGNAVARSYAGKASVSGRKFRIRVFNTSGNRRSGPVSVKASVSGDIAVTDASGKTVPCSWDPGTSEISFIADVPAFGYATYEVRPKKKSRPAGEDAVTVSGETVVVENGMYRIAFDGARGGIVTELAAKNEGGREFVDTESDFGFGELRGYFYDEGKWRSSADCPAKITVSKRTPWETVVAIEGEIASSPFRKTVVLREGDRKISCRLEIDWKADAGIGAYAQKDAYDARKRAFYEDSKKLNVLFPVAVVDASLYKNAPFDVCESGHSDTFYDSWDGIKHNVILNWTDICGKDGAGFAVLSDHTTSYSYGKDFPFALTAQFSGNGLWGRNYPISGPTVIEYAVIPHSGTWDESGICGESLDWNEPLHGVVIADAALEDVSYADTGDSGYEISAAYPDGDGLVVRLFNASGTDAPCAVRFGFGIRRMCETDLLGGIVREIPVRTEGNMSEAVVSMPRFGVRTYLIETEKR